MTETNIGSNERRGSEMPTERGSTPRLSLDTLDSFVGAHVQRSRCRGMLLDSFRTKNIGQDVWPNNK